MKKTFDLMKWWPLITAIVFFIATCAVLLYRMDAIEKRVDKMGEWLQRVSQKEADIDVKIARIEGR